jgi:hypothetical protein
MAWKSRREVRHPPNSFGSLRGMPAVVTRAHAAGAGTIRVHQAAADMNSSSVLLGFSFEREHRPDWRRAFGALRDVRPITLPRNRSVDSASYAIAFAAPRSTRSPKGLPVLEPLGSMWHDPQQLQHVHPEALGSPSGYVVPSGSSLTTASSETLDPSPPLMDSRRGLLHPRKSA